VSLPRVLFVDDEPRVLEGLRNLLRKQRKDWDLSFALGGPAALAELEQRPFDLVVSDMRMPTMDGAALLAQVKARWPQTSRVILSGHAEFDAVSRSLPVASQFLSKPCDGEVLRQCVARICAQRRRVADPLLLASLSGLERLHASPAVHQALLAALDEGPDAVARLISTDPAMTAKVLQLVNSAFFGLARPEGSVRAAVQCLGPDLLRKLVRDQAVFDPLPEGRLDAATQVGLEALRLATLEAARTAPTEGEFTATMLGAVGAQVLALHGAEPGLGASAQAGACLLGIWGLPTALVERLAAAPPTPLPT
jgi:DNA-binding NarL/FixJ family response regulator